MCGRFGLHVSTQKIAAFFGALQLFDFEPKYNIAPSEPVLVALQRPELPQPHLDLFRWGLIPQWAQDAKIANHLVNARSESAAVKPAFRGALKYRRCILPASGFYEWRRDGKHKQAYYITPTNEPLLAMAGLWETWNDPATGADLSSCCILTTEANRVMAPIHDRMPVLLAPRDFTRWLDPREHRVERFQGLFAPCRDAWIQALPVSSYVNRTGNQGPECIAPFDPASETQSAQQTTPKTAARKRTPIKANPPAQIESVQLSLFDD